MVKNKKSPNQVRFETSGHSNSDTEEIELDDISPNASQRKFTVGFAREREISTNSGDFLGGKTDVLPFFCFLAKRKNACFSVNSAGTKSVVNVGHFFGGPDGPTKFR